MPDTVKMREIVKHFEFSSKPSSASSSDNCTVGDINKVIHNAAQMMYAIIIELEQPND